MHFLRSFKFYANVGIASLVMSLSSAYASPAVDAGEVTFSLGKAFLNGGELIQVGSKIQEGDVIETLGNGHVHIRFVDNGLVSVRPDSRLSIEHYSYDAEHPKDSVIKFTLNEGVMRSISGSGAKAARDKFRLNTPIAAIGVRGTDFVVKASEDLMQAVVNEGAIVVAPFSSSCNADALGPCSDSVELGSDTQQLLELTSLYDTPRLIPLSAAFNSGLIDESSLNTNSAKKSSEEESAPSTDSDDADQSGTLEESNTLNQSSTSSADRIQRIMKSLTDTGISESDALKLIEESNAANAAAELGEPNVTSSKLAWGRFGSTPVKDYDTVIKPFSEAAENRKLTPVAVPGGVNGLPNGAALFRAPSDLKTIDSSLGNVSFVLDIPASQANLYRVDQDINNPENVTFNSGSSLNIDFQKGTFDTSVGMTLIDSQQVTFETEGIITQDGILMAEDGSFHDFGGITTLEGDSATYMFYKDVENVGTIEGVTSWH